LTLQAGSANSPCGTGTGGPICTTNGNVTLRDDDMSIGHSITGTGTVTLAPYTTGNNINIQGSTVPGVLNLTQTELGNITAGTLAIGNASTGNIDIVGVTLSAPVLNLT